MMSVTEPENDPMPADGGLRRSWLHSDRSLPRRVVRPLERFLELEAGSAALLFAAALAALVWTNVAEDSYREFWSTHVTLDAGPLDFDEDLRHIVNDLLMAVFFYVVALEVKRELLFGSLRDRASAAVPVAAALGTMAGGALVYLAFNLDGGEARGWAIPIATDIAFALGVLGLAGRRAPRELRAFLLTLAVVDDLGTIAVIGIFYSGGIAWAWLAAAAAVTLAVLGLGRLGVRFLASYALLAVALWWCVLESGVHATIAGVVLGFLTPAVALHHHGAAEAAIRERMAQPADDDAEDREGRMWGVSRVAREAVSPLRRMETYLHPWTAFVILPVFALANAGVPLSLAELGDALGSRIGLGILLGLVVGAPAGGLIFAWAVVRGTPARMPDGLDWSAVGGVAPLKGIGFTVAIFISVLAFEEPNLQEEAKLAILVASAVAGAIGLAVLLIRHARVQARSDV
jgi:NhaA family Na+:H+ antiporter